jgi:hypothetical protein
MFIVGSSLTISLGYRFVKIETVATNPAVAVNLDLAPGTRCSRGT